MSKIDPPAGWPDVDGIDPFERLLGGPLPVSPINRSIGNLTARTKYLRDNMVSASTLEEPNGSATIGFVQAGVGMTARTLQSKGRDVVSAADRGLLGNGTDETTALQNLLDAAAGKVLMLEAGKTYGVNPTVGLTFPANTSIVANGAKFKRTAAQSGPVTDASYNIVIGDNTEIDRLEVECVGGAGDIGGVIVSGSQVNIGTLKIVPGAAGSAAIGLAWVGVRIGPNSGTARGVHIRELVMPNWDRTAVIQNIEGGSIGYADVNTYRRAIYLKDCAHFDINGGYIRGKSANSLGSAGDNGILMESTISHGSLHDIRINNLTVEDSGEHGYRIGGGFVVRNVWHTACHAKNTGAGNNGANYPPENNGGCGFKVLGPTITFGSRHQNIHYIGCSVADINATSIANVVARGSSSNFAGFQIGKVFGGSIVNPVVLVSPASDGSYAETGNSCVNGIEIIGSQKITVTNPQIQRPARSGVFIYDFSDGVNDWGQTDDIDIVGGHVNLPVVAGVEVVCGVITMRRISIQGSLAVGGGESALKVTKSGAGAFVSCFADMRAVTQSVESFAGLGTDWTIRAQGNEVGASACRNGSTFQSDTAGTLRVRKAGAWASL